MVRADCKPFCDEATSLFNMQNLEENHLRDEEEQEGDPSAALLDELKKIRQEWNKSELKHRNDLSELAAALSRLQQEKGSTIHDVSTLSDSSSFGDNTYAASLFTTVLTDYPGESAALLDELKKIRQEWESSESKRAFELRNDLNSVAAILFRTFGDIRNLTAIDADEIANKEERQLYYYVLCNYDSFRELSNAIVKAIELKQIMTMLKFFLSFETLGSNTTLPIQLEAKVNEYLSLIMRLIFAFGISFQLPILLNLLARIGVVNSNYLKTRRRYVIVIIFAIAAILTPPDPITQVGLAIPLLLLYELSIFTVKFTERNKEKESLEDA